MTEFKDALEEFDRDCRFIDVVADCSNLVRRDFMHDKARETIRRALRIADRLTQEALNDSLFAAQVSFIVREIDNADGDGV